MKTKHYILLLVLLLGGTGCNKDDTFGTAYILPNLYPKDIGINLFDASGKHRQAASPATEYTLEVGFWSAVAYANASEVKETSGHIVNIPVEADGRLTQPRLSVSITPFIITEGKRLEFSLVEFRPITRELIVVCHFSNTELVKVKDIKVRLKKAMSVVDVLKGFGTATPADASHYVESSDGKFYLPAAPQETDGAVEAEIIIDIEGLGFFILPVSFYGIAADFNAGPVTEPFYTEVVEIVFSPEGVEVHIKPWDKDPELEIPGT